jgi:hypothetical protein
MHFVSIILITFILRIYNYIIVYTWNKLCLQVFQLQAWADLWGSGRLRLRIFSIFDTMKVVRCSPLRTGRLYPPGVFLVLIFRSSVDPRARWFRLQLRKKSPTTPLGYVSRTHMQRYSYSVVIIHGTRNVISDYKRFVIVLIILLLFSGQGVGHSGWILSLEDNTVTKFWSH